MIACGDTQYMYTVSYVHSCSTIHNQWVEWLWLLHRRVLESKMEPHVGDCVHYLTVCKEPLVVKDTTDGPIRILWTWLFNYWWIIRINWLVNVSVEVITATTSSYKSAFYNNISICFYISALIIWPTIPLFFLSSQGKIQPWEVVTLRRLFKTQYQPLPSQLPIYTPGWREAIIVKHLAQGHKIQDRDLNPHPHHLTTRAQFHKACELKNLLSTEKSCSAETVYQPTFHKV